ncbi:MAG: site-specific integrase [Dysgonamonadaceae bacterium]|jgi:site-specific recombinase XerD|nr:site-specific integrase [Dysgonamonadaceae bacterium]
MDNVQLRYVFDRLKQANNDTKKGLLQIEARKSGTNVKKLISTGVHLYKNQFSDRNGFTCKNHDNAPAITGKVTRMFRQIEAFVLSDKCSCLDDIRNWNRNESEIHSVVEFMRDSLRKRNPSAAIMEHHNVLIRQIQEFGRIKVFSDITYENIADFDLFLRRTIHSQPTLYKRHSTFKSYIVDAINRGMCPSNPYIQFKIQKGKSKTPTFLSESEIKQIQAYTPVNEKLQKVKDLFIFQCFTGMAFVDVMNFSKSDISEVDGMKIIRSSRVKTDESFISLFLPEAEKIAEKYDYQLPKLSNQKYNDYLKLLGAGAGINKNITSHVARHTFATYLINKDIPVESVSKALGHASIKQTQHYAKLAGKKVIHDMSKLLQKPAE